MAKKHKEEEPVEEVVEEPVEEVVEEPVEEVVEEPVEEVVEEPVEEKPFVKPEQICNRCKSVMVVESKDGFETIYKCPKCNAVKSRC